MSIAKPTTFPYLAIAKRHDLDYGHVLRVADICSRGNMDNGYLRDNSMIPEPAFSEILGAVARFKLIQQGIVKPW